MKKVLIITYYWPPAGGPGVQRVLKFVKYLPQFGWQPIILTVNNGEYPAIDESLTEEIPKECIIYKTKSIEPNKLYKSFTGISPGAPIPTAVLSEGNQGIKKKTAHWIRSNIFIPDAKIGWKYFAVKEGKKIIDELKPDVIFSSSPPPTVHLIAYSLAEYGGKRWIADFRDPWTEIHYYEHVKRLNLSVKLDKKLELKVLKKADAVTCISQLDIENDFSKKIDAEKCYHLPNGYDENDFDGIVQKKNDDRKFSIIHTGAVGGERNPSNLFKAVKNLEKDGIISTDNLSLTFIGSVSNEVINCYKQFHIEKYIEIIPYIPHKEALKQSAEADMMLLLVTQSKGNKRILPGKTFEYIRLNDNILMLGPEDGETARIIKSTETGTAIDYDNYDKIYETLKTSIQKYRNGKVYNTDNLSKIAEFERKKLTEKLVEIFNGK